MPLLFDIIQELVPADYRIFIWADDNYEVANLYSPELPPLADVAVLYATEFVNKRECEVKPSFAHIMKTERGVINWTKYENKKYFKSDFYNMLLKPLQARYVLGAVIADHRHGLGDLIFLRRAGRKHFGPREEKNLTSLIAYIAHGLAEGYKSDISYVDSNRKGLIILNQQGEIQYLCAQARELLFWAKDPRFSQKALKWSSSVSLPDELLTIARNLICIYQGIDAPPPVLHCRNGWGLFTFRAYWLEGEKHDKQGLIGITVDMQEPQPVRLFSQLRKFPLSPRQKEVCLMLLSGYRNQEISQKLNISRHTLIHHIRGIYEKIGLHSQAELLAKFGISLAAEPQFLPSRHRY